MQKADCRLLSHRVIDDWRMLNIAECRLSNEDFAPFDLPRSAFGNIHPSAVSNRAMNLHSAISHLHCAIA
jgi:hypothetical protein